MQDRNFTNKSKPKTDKEKDKEGNLINNNKLILHVNSNLITKKISDVEKNNKIIKKNTELDNKNNLIYKNMNTKNFPNENLGLLRDNNLNLNNKKSKMVVNNLESKHEKKIFYGENENKNKKLYKEEMQNEDELEIKENNNFSNQEKHHHMQKTETSMYSYVNRSTQLDYYHDLLNFIKSEKNKSNKIFSNNKIKSSSSNLNNERKTANKNSIPAIERFKFNFDVTIRLTLNKFYNLYPIELNKIVVENLIFNKNCHLVSVFKDHMIFDYVDEFLKRFYFYEESKERIPKISNYYKNYLKFFCNPIFRDFKVNNIIQGYGDYKAEMYYNRNYGNKANNNNGDENDDYNQPRKRHHQENSRLKKIFDTNAKINIERNSIMSCSNMSIKQQIFNESNFQYYIDKIQINKMKGLKDFNPVMLYEDEKDFNGKRNLDNKNDFSNVNASKYTNTLLEFSQYNLQNYCFTNNNNDDSRRLNNDENSNLLLDNFKNDISNIMQYKDLQKIFKEQGKNFEKENKFILNKNMHSGLNGIINSEKYITKTNKDINDNIIRNNLEKIVKNNQTNKRNYNSNFNEYESKTMIKNSNKNFPKDENLYTNRSNEESILSLINIIDLNDGENLTKSKNKNREKNDYRSKEMAKESQITIRHSNKIDGVDNKNADYKSKITKANSQPLHNNSQNKNEKKTIMQLEQDSNKNYKILSKGLNNDNPYIIKKPDFKENRISVANNSVLNKLNFKNIHSNSNSKSKSNSKTFTDPNNNSNNAYLGLNTSKTLTNHNKSNYTNSSAINIKSAANQNEKSDLKQGEIQGKSVFKPKINSVEIIKSNFDKNIYSNFNQEKLQINRYDSDKIYFQSGEENYKKASSSKFIEKSNAQLIDRALTINLLNKNNRNKDDTLQLVSTKNCEQYAFKMQDKSQAVEKTIRTDSKNLNNYKEFVSNSNSKDKTYEKKLFSTLDPSSLLLNSQSKFNLLSPNENKNSEINGVLNSKNIVVSDIKYNTKKRDLRPRDSEIHFNQANDKLSPSNKNGINAFKANNNIINYNLYNKSLNPNNFDGKKINLAANKNSDDTTNTHTKSAEIRINNNLKNQSTKTSDIEIINLNQAQELNKNKINPVINPPQITLNYKINSRNHNQNNHLIKITNSNSNNLVTGNDNTNSNVNFNKSENNNKYVISNLKHNTHNVKFSTVKNPVNLVNAVKEGIPNNNFITNSSVYNSNLNMTDKIKKSINTYSRNTPSNHDRIMALSESKQQHKNNYSKDIKKPNDFKQKLSKKASINASNKAFTNINQNNINNNNKNYNNHHEHNHIENFKSENSNSNHIELIGNESVENLTPNAINEINNNILINNPNLMNKPKALTDIMKITLSFYMDKSNSRNNQPISNTSSQNSANNIINNQLGSINVLNDNLKKTTVINKIQNLNKFNININNQFNLGNINTINANQLQQINNIANLNPGIFINNGSNTNSIANMNNNLNNNNGILEYNAKKKSQNKTISNKTIDNNANNQINHISSNISNNISATTHNGKLLKFNEKSQISEITNYGFPVSENKNSKNNSDNYNYKNQESSCLSTNNKFNKSSNLENAYFNLEKKTHISIDKPNNIYNNNENKNDINGNLNTNINSNVNNSNLKLTFSQDINSLKNIIEKNKILSRNKNANLFKISSNQNMTKPGIISEEDISNPKDLNAKTNYVNSNNYPNTILNLNSTNKNSSVFFNASKNKNSFTEKSDLNPLKDNNFQIRAFNSYAHKEKEVTNTSNQKKVTNKSPNSNATEGNQLVYLKKTIDEKNLKLAITKLKLPSPSAKGSNLTNDADTGNKIKINLNSNKKQSTDSFIQKDFNSAKENINNKINFNTNLKNLKISFENKNISAGDSNNNLHNKFSNSNNLNVISNMINLNKNPSYNSLIKSKDSQIDPRANVLSNKNAKKIVFIKK